MEDFQELLETQNIIITLLIIIGVIIVLFLPGIVALFRNPKRAKLIFIGCIPSVLSFWVWFGLLAWAISGKEFAPKKK